jgi:hypothetical protein
MSKRYLAVFFIFACAAFTFAASAFGGNWSALLLSGGGVPSSNAVAHEKNILFAQRTLQTRGVGPKRVETFVSLGAGEGKDVSYVAGVPAERWELALLDRLFGHGGIELAYRRHEIPAVSGTARKEDVLQGIRRAASRLSRGDTLFLYGTDHGQRNEENPDDNLLVLWGDKTLSVSELRESLAPAGKNGRVIAAFAQCYSGAFANLIWAEDGQTLAAQDRCGFFSTSPSREAAGCTPEIDEAEYDDFSTRLFSALGGVDRLGRPIRSTDYDADGRVSFSEAHAYAMASEETIDVPLKTSEFYLARKNVPAEGDWAAALGAALPEERAAWAALEKRLRFAGEPSAAVEKGLQGASRAVDELYEKRDALHGELRGIEDELRLSLLERWPFLETPFHPEFAKLVHTGEAVRGVLLREPRVTVLNQLYGRYGEIAERILAAEVEEAWWMRAQNLHHHILRAYNAAGQAKKDLQRLQACEAAVPGR